MCSSCERSVNHATNMACMLLPTCDEQQSIVRFLWAKGHNPSEIHRDMCGVYGEDCMDCSNVSRWCTFFKDDHENLCDLTHSSRSFTAATPQNVTTIEAAIFNDRQIQLRALFQQFNISQGAAYNIVHDTLKFHKVNAHWVPKILTDNKGQLIMTSLNLLMHYFAEGHGFMTGIVTGDELWAHHYMPETKQTSMEWKPAAVQ